MKKRNTSYKSYFVGFLIKEYRSVATEIVTEFGSSKGQKEILQQQTREHMWVASHYVHYGVCQIYIELLFCPGHTNPDTFPLTRCRLFSIQSTAEWIRSTVYPLHCGSMHND
jgi:hypothetical protein